jgi:hypothetical protein
MNLNSHATPVTLGWLERLANEEKKRGGGMSIPQQSITNLQKIQLRVVAGGGVVGRLGKRFFWAVAIGSQA